MIDFVLFDLSVKHQIMLDLPNIIIEPCHEKTNILISDLV